MKGNTAARDFRLYRYAYSMEGLTRVLMGIACNYFSVLYISIICVIRNSMHLVRFSYEIQFIKFGGLIPATCIILSLDIYARSQISSFY